MSENRNQVPTLVVRRVVQAKRDRVFEAWSNPEMMQEWFHPPGGRSVVSNDLRVNGKFQNEMIIAAQAPGCTDGPTSEEEQSYVHTGEYLEIVRPEKLVFTWNSHLVRDSRVTVELADLGEATEVTITHELLETEDLRSKHNMGWDRCLQSLEDYLAC